MSATARFVEFLGYQEAPTPMPLIRSNSVSADALLWDGQTHLLQMSPITNRVQFVDRVPVFSDIPIVGRLFRTSGSQLHIRQRLVLITPTLIDPAGRRLYDAQHRPFDPATKP
jgi:type IV pilus assembly protein PilQ